jgi:UPF0176 protein
MRYHVTTFYTFLPLEKDTLPIIKERLEYTAQEHSVEGLMLIAPEGVNGTISGSKEGIVAYKRYLEDTFGTMKFKDSPSNVRPFKKFKVKIKEEIVALKDPSVVPDRPNNHLSPEEWNAVLTKEDVVVIDVRNWYETKLGTFKNAIDPKTLRFSQFPEFVQKSGIPKDKKVLMYCTGGIRCEKASVAMQQQGYDQVYQLDGGILNYIQHYPNQQFEGECFVFDRRVSVKQDLRPTEEYKICPHCGDPGNIRISCAQCKQPCTVCEQCMPEQHNQTCSKQCKYHFAQHTSHDINKS